MIRRAALFLAVAAAALAQAHKTAPAAPLPSYHELKYPDLRPIAPSAIENLTLPNGMRLFLSENHELPVINGTVLVRTGSAFDPPGKIGLASLAGQVLLESGAGTRPGADLTLRFQNLGVQVEGVVSDNTLSITFAGLKENSDAVLDTLKDSLTRPDFPQDRLDFAKSRMRNAIGHRNDDAAAILRREFAAAVYGKHSPYGVQVEYADMDRINRADLVNFYQRYFFPKNVMLWLEGDFDTAAMKGRITALFGDWTSQQPPVAEFPGVGGAGTPGKFLAMKKDVSQAFFAVGQLGGMYQDKDYPALEIMADILGGGPQSRLNQRLFGTVEGLTVNWGASFGHPGLFRVSGTVVNPFFTTKSLRIVFEELDKIRAVEVSEDELKTAKAAALNSLVFAFDNQLSTLSRLTQYAYFNLPGDFTQQYQKALEVVTRADVLRVARERLDPAKISSVVVGNPTAFEAPLESLGGPAVIPIDLTIPESKPEAALGDAVTARHGKELLARAQQAMGGADKLAAVTDYIQEIAYQFDPSAGGGQASMIERWITPGYLRQDTEARGGKLSVYCDGQTGWVGGAQTSNLLAGLQLKQVQSDLFRIFFPLILSDRLPNRKVNALDDTTVEISDGAGQIAKVVFDPVTGLLQNTLYDAPTAKGPVPVIDTYSDYRDVGGLKLPFKVVIALSGQKFQELTTRNMQLNTGLKIQDLEKRP